MGTTWGQRPHERLQLHTQFRLEYVPLADENVSTHIDQTREISVESITLLSRAFCTISWYFTTHMNIVYPNEGL